MVVGTSSVPNSYTCLHYHAIFSAKDRAPLIDATWCDRLHEYMGGIIRDEKGHLRAVAGTPDHVHLLLSLHPQKGLSDVMRQVKASSSRWIHETVPGLRGFAWQDGYAALTASYSSLGQIKQYMAGQEQHHRRVSFQEEFVEFLRLHEIPYDERYIFP
jgi:putative transposase